VDDVEGEEGHDPLDESLQVVVVGAEATQKVQHQGTVGEGLVEVAEGVHHALHLAVVLTHGEVPPERIGETAHQGGVPEPPGYNGTAPRG
jgi:uncharacterized NAD(P)/FAD-binding protein YdhS